MKTRMKTTYLSLLGLIQFFLICFSASGSVIPISTVEELQKIGYDADYPLSGSYALAKNIDASVTSGWNDGAGFLPIGGTAETAEPFTGNFVGNGYRIMNLNIHQPTLFSVGLFRETGETAVIREVGLVGGEVGGAGLTGSLVGFHAGIVERCYMISVLVVGQQRAGGLVAANQGMVRDCFARGSVNSYHAAGGLVSSAMNDALENSFAASVLLPWGIQWAQFNSLGQWNGSGSYGDSDVASSADGIWVSGYTTAEMTYPYGTGMYADWDFDTVWIADVDGTLNDGYPYLRSAITNFAGGLGTADQPYLVATAEQLNRVRQYNGAHFRQIADIDLGGAPWNEGAGWVPMYRMYQDDWFTGVYDGDNFKIISLTIDHYIADDGEWPGPYGGLFASIGDDGVVRNVVLEGGQVRGGYMTVGSLFGDNAGLIENCHSSTEVLGEYESVGGLAGENRGTIRSSSASGFVSGEAFVGGLVGWNLALIEDSFATGAIEASQESAGGLVGDNDEGIVRRCYATGAVSSVGGDTEFSGLGGLVGLNSGLVEESYATGAVTGHGSNAGGLTGENQGVIRNCFARGNVLGVGGVGGLVGGNSQRNDWDTGLPIAGTGLIEYTYSTGAVEGATGVGGLVGTNQSQVSFSYWDTETSGQSFSAGGEGCTTAALTFLYWPYCDYEDWDFTNVWEQGNDGYMQLQAFSGGISTFSLSYLAGEGGSLTGLTTQTVDAGQSGSEVTAVPDAGAVFSSWSDGVLTASRTDTNVQANLEVTATFRSEGGVELDWYAGHGITPREGQTWADVDSIVPPGKTFTLQQHFVAMLDPHDPASRFGAGQPQRVGGAFEVPFHPSSPDRHYTLWRTTDLAIWTIVPGQERVPGGNGPLVDANAPEASAFYRIEVSIP